MKILYDYQICISQKFGGISRYYYELLNNINDMDLAEAEMVCQNSINAYFKDYFKEELKVRPDGIKGLVTFFKFQNQNIRNTKKIIKQGNYDILHPTYYNPYILKYKKNAKVVLTVYDMIHEKFPECFAPYDYTKLQKKKMILGADHIIAISESTKRDILELYPQVNSDKISVIYISSEFNFTENSSMAGDFPKEYVLFVGKRGGYKNFNKFAQAMNKVLDVHPELSVMCLGGGKFSDEEFSLMGRYKDKYKQINVSDDVLAYAYSHAKCFVFPSLYEGFGIPTLEAFTCNCPVVLSNTSSMPEVGGDAVEYCNPSDADDICSAITKVIENQDLRVQMIEKGHKQLEKFKWSEIAKQTVECYKKILNQ